MACFRPLAAWQLEGGEIVFVERGKVLRELRLPCGRCIGCRQVRVRAWSLRCMHEAQMHEFSSFVTLTYDDANYAPSLNYSHFQDFMRALRRKHGRARFFMCGEYGEQTLRPHFHALLFGVRFDNLSQVGKSIFRSPALEALWPFGFSSIGDVTRESAAYVARYSLKKVSGERASRHYSRVDLRTGEVVDVVPEFGHMSLKPGIGYTWFEKYWRDVFLCRDGVVVNGRVVPPPRYYTKLLETVDPDRSEGLELDRYLSAGRFAEDTTPARLAVREICAIERERNRAERCL